MNPINPIGVLILSSLTYYIPYMSWVDIGHIISTGQLPDSTRVEFWKFARSLDEEQKRGIQIALQKARERRKTAKKPQL